MKLKETSNSTIHFYWRWQLKETPDNFVYVTRKRTFGFFYGYEVKIAKPNYPWRTKYRDYLLNTKYK